MWHPCTTPWPPPVRHHVATTLYYTSGTLMRRVQWLFLAGWPSLASIHGPRWPALPGEPAGSLAFAVMRPDRASGRRPLRGAEPPLILAPRRGRYPFPRREVLADIQCNGTGAGMCLSGLIWPNWPSQVAQEATFSFIHFLRSRPDLLRPRPNTQSSRL